MATESLSTTFHNNNNNNKQQHNNHNNNHPLIVSFHSYCTKNYEQGNKNQYIIDLYQ